MIKWDFSAIFDYDVLLQVGMAFSEYGAQGV